MVNPYYPFLGLLALERVMEMRLSARNARRALARGGVEEGRGHFPLMVCLHGAWFASAALEPWLLHRPFLPPLAWAMVGVALGAQALRYWAVRTLGPAWNVRVIVVPGEAACQGGPYRFLRHPNYLAVVVEIAAVPLIHTAWLTALVFSLANALVLRVRIRCEEEALARHGDYEARLGDRPRLLPLRLGADPP